MKKVTEKEIIEFFKSLGFQLSPLYDMSIDDFYLKIKCNNWCSDWKLSANIFALIAQYFQTWDFNIKIISNKFEINNVNSCIEFEILRRYIDITEEN